MHYRTLSTSLAQSVVRKVDEAMKAFFGSIKSKKAKLPRYLDKDGLRLKKYEPKGLEKDIQTSVIKRKSKDTNKKHDIAHD